MFNRTRKNIVHDIAEEVKATGAVREPRREAAQ